MREVSFTPTTYFQPDTMYTVTVTGIKNILGRTEGSHDFSFRTAPLPVVVTTRLLLLLLGCLLEG